MLTAWLHHTCDGQLMLLAQLHICWQCDGSESISSLLSANLWRLDPLQHDKSSDRLLAESASFYSWHFLRMVCTSFDLALVTLVLLLEKTSIMGSKSATLNCGLNWIKTSFFILSLLKSAFYEVVIMGKRASLSSDNLYGAFMKLDSAYKG